MAANTASGTPRAKLVGDGDEFTVDGRRFRLNIERDDCLGEPWKEHDCHGVVSDWTTRKKKAGERILAEDRGSYRYYDVQASIARALRDWIDPIARTTDGTRGERAAKAVEADYERLRRWCKDQWWWAWLKVTSLEGKGKGEYESLGGMESDCVEHIIEEAHNLAQQLLHAEATRPPTSAEKLAAKLRELPEEYLVGVGDLDTDEQVMDACLLVIDRLVGDEDG